MSVSSRVSRLPLVDAVDDLRLRIDGEVLLPPDAGYDAARLSWNLSFEHRPAVVVVPASASDVSEAVRFAVATDLHVAAHATGHGVSRTADGALLLVTSRLDDIAINPVTGRAWIGAGNQWGPVLAQAQAHGLAPLMGSSPIVGAVGYTLGGGMGWLARKYGLSADSVRMLEVVTADGRVVRATATENAELFWGLRGAGAGSLAVVTGMEVQLYPVTHVYAGNLFYPAERAREVLARWRTWVGSVPDELTSSVALMSFPPLEAVPAPFRGRSFAIVRGCYAGSDGDGEQLMRHWREWETPVLDAFGPLPFSEMASISQDPVDPLPARATQVWLDDLTADAIDTVVDGAFGPGGAPPPLVVAEVRHAGGAISRGGTTAASYGNREAPLSLEMVGMTLAPGDIQALEAHTSAVKAALGGVRTGGQYLNFLEGEEKRHAADAALGVDNARRARRLKSAVDSGDLFDRGLDLVRR